MNTEYHSDNLSGRWVVHEGGPWYDDSSYQGTEDYGAFPIYFSFMCTCLDASDDMLVPPQFSVFSSLYFILSFPLGSMDGCILVVVMEAVCTLYYIAVNA